jgi:hypothetical protein
MRPALVVTVDTEEEGLWSGIYRPHGNPCRNIEHLPRAHEIFARLGVRPTYLVAHAAVEDDGARRVLASLVPSSEIGAHLHPWCTPPLLPGGTRPQNTYAHHLPPELQAAKLETLSRALVDGLGVRPRVYRAGRWGFGASTVPVLERLGILVDSSVDPLWWDSEPGGPAFLGAPQRPYRLDRADVTRAGDSEVLEVPVSTAIVGGWRGLALERVVRALAPRRGMRRLLLRAGLGSLKPEHYPLDVMRAVADELARRGAPVFNVAFHSSTLLPGATPFARDAAGVDAFLARLDGLLRHLLGRHEAVPLGLSAAAQASSADWNSRTKRAAVASSE